MLAGDPKKTRGREFYTLKVIIISFVKIMPSDNNRKANRDDTAIRRRWNSGSIPIRLSISI